EPAQRAAAKGADERPPDEAVPPQLLGDSRLGARRFEVEMDPRLRTGQVAEDGVERRQLAGLERLVVCDHERAVDLVDVELDEVATELDRERDRLERVLRRERRRAAMADPQHAAVAPREVDHTRLTTTTAQSSASSPANARQSSTSASASCFAGSPACAASDASSRFSPYSSPSRRPSIRPSVNSTAVSPGASWMRSASYA